MPDRQHARGGVLVIVMVITMAWSNAGETPLMEGLLDEDEFKRRVSFKKMAARYDEMNMALFKIVSSPDPMNSSRSSKALAIDFLRSWKTYEPMRDSIIRKLAHDIDYHPRPYSISIPAEQRYPAAMALSELGGNDSIEGIIYSNIASGDRTPEQIYLGVFVMYSILGGKELVMKALESSKVPGFNEGKAILEKARKSLEWAEAPNAWRKKLKPFVLPEGHPLLNQNPDCRGSVLEEKK